MAITTVQANGLNYLFAPDDDPPRAARAWMLVRARLVNDVTLRPVTEDVQLTSDLPLTTPRISDDGIVGLVAVPKDVFPILAGRNYTFNLTLHARRFLSHTVAVIIPTHQKMTVNPLPAIGSRIITLDDTLNLEVGELLMIGNPSVVAGSAFEVVRIEALGPGPNQVSIRPALQKAHAAAVEPVIPVIPTNFGPTDAGDVLMVPQP